MKNSWKEFYFVQKLFKLATKKCFFYLDKCPLQIHFLLTMRIFIVVGTVFVVLVLLFFVPENEASKVRHKRSMYQNVGHENGYYYDSSSCEAKYYQIPPTNEHSINKVSQWSDNLRQPLSEFNPDDPFGIKLNQRFTSQAILHYIFITCVKCIRYNEF